VVRGTMGSGLSMISQETASVLFFCQHYLLLSFVICINDLLLAHKGGMRPGCARRAGTRHAPRGAPPPRTGGRILARRLWGVLRWGSAQRSV